MGRHPVSAVSGSAWQAVEQVREGVGLEENATADTQRACAHALAALALLQQLADAAEKACGRAEQLHLTGFGQLANALAAVRAGADAGA